MTARMTNPAMILPEAMKGVGSFLNAISTGGVPDETLELVNLRASQINGCSPCVHGHTAKLRETGVSEQKIAAVAAWRHAPFFSEAELAALKLTETLTRLADRSDEAVPDELWAEVAEHFDEKGLAALVLNIALINSFNRINAAVQEPAGTTW
ncbi:carboxymuconolactone decarboxylase family protein [Amycolatopsis nigrescens]|uniref:carboxymuconolactone decarboxylase family protein n=1 Tax=Amycolatopsis nigrescens TaxID=381445 RepID=UPI0003A20B36|nr:carboxymuconolactone decarboxylase family protein [Amycolatopsis nigrescens]